MLENTEIVRGKTQQTLGAVHTHTHTHTHIYSYRRIAGQSGERERELVSLSQQLKKI